jgi:hypothetical protein
MRSRTSVLLPPGISFNSPSASDREYMVLFMWRKTSRNLRKLNKIRAFLLHVHIISTYTFILYRRESFCQSGAINNLCMNDYINKVENRRTSVEGPEVRSRLLGVCAGNGTIPQNDFVTMILYSPGQSSTLDNRPSTCDSIHVYSRASRATPTLVNRKSYVVNINCAIWPLPLTSSELISDTQANHQQDIMKISVPKVYRTEINFRYTNGTETAQFFPVSLQRLAFSLSGIPLTFSPAQYSTRIVCRHC